MDRSAVSDMVIRAVPILCRLVPGTGRPATCVCRKTAGDYDMLVDEEHGSDCLGGSCVKGENSRCSPVFGRPSDLLFFESRESVGSPSQG